MRPPWALLAGGALGAICFALCALFLGHVTGIAIGLVLAIVALARRAVQAAVLFVAAAALCGAGLFVAPATAIFAAALCFGGGLVALASAHR